MYMSLFARLRYAHSTLPATSRRRNADRRRNRPSVELMEGRQLLSLLTPVVSPDTSGSPYLTISAVPASSAVPADNAPTLNPVANVTVFENTGLQTISLSGITDGDNNTQSLTVTAASSNPALIANPTVNYTSPQTTGTLSLIPTANASGTATIAVTVTDNGSLIGGGTSTVVQTFNVTVTPVNQPPTLNAIANPAPVTENSGPQTVTLSGITAGLGDTGQALTVSVRSSNPALIANPTVNYTSPSTTGTLTFTPTPATIGNSVISVTVTDDGGVANGGLNTLTQSFTVSVVAPAPPTLNTIASPAPISLFSGTQTVPLSGISPGPNEIGQNLTFFAYSSNPSLISNVSVNYTNPSSTGSVSYTPTLWASGTATIYVYVMDYAEVGTGVYWVEQSFNVTVAPVLPSWLF